MNVLYTFRIYSHKVEATERNAAIDGDAEILRKRDRV
jgi:hypothetical protein